MNIINLKNYKEKQIFKIFKIKFDKTKKKK